MTEKQIETQILAWLNFQKNTFAFKVNTVGIFDPVKKVFRRNMNRFIVKGTSDILGVSRGKMIAIEVKTPESYKKMDHRMEQQLSFIERVKHSGGYGLVTYSLDGVIEWFKQLHP
jgi:penicillin-binding protein-related factor A (putative recombinase)